MRSDIAEVCRHLEVSEQTFHRSGGMKAKGAKRPKELERENQP